MENINPPSFYEKETISLCELQEQRAELLKKQNAIGSKQIVLDCIIEKATKKIEVITNSNAIPYQLAGGYFNRQRDLLKAESVLNRLNNYWNALNEQWNELEYQMDELTYQIKTI